MSDPDGIVAVMSSLFGLVTLGSIVPVVPTGAVLSAAVAVAAHGDPLRVLIAVVIGAAGAYLGDLVTYAVCRTGGEPVTRRLARSKSPAGFAEAVRRHLTARPTSALVVARLVPGGRVPVLLAAAVLDVGWRRVAFGSVVSCLVWSAAYAGIGLLGGVVFPEPWQAVVAVVLLALVLSALVGRVRHRFAPVPPEPDRILEIDA